MNKIARFEEFSKNEELTHGINHPSEYGGSQLLQKVSSKVGRWLGSKLFGNEVDIMRNILDGILNDPNQRSEFGIDEKNIELVKSEVERITTEGMFKKKSEEEITEILMEYIPVAVSNLTHLLNK
jgi:hypothetical protein